MATITASNDDSESVDQFLARIASLKDKRDREDEERTRKLEEEILQGRKERQARRAGEFVVLLCLEDLELETRLTQSTRRRESPLNISL
jgi:hypothetical protein